MKKITKRKRIKSLTQMAERRLHRKLNEADKRWLIRPYIKTTEQYGYGIEARHQLKRFIHNTKKMERTERYLGLRHRYKRDIMSSEKYKRQIREANKRQALLRDKKIKELKRHKRIQTIKDILTFKQIRELKK